VTRRRPPRRARVLHENSVVLMSMASGLAGVLASMILLWTGDYSPKVQWTATLFIVGPWLIFAFAVRSIVMRPLQTLSNMHAALREGDYSMRARASNPQDSLGELMYEVNALTEMLREQKLGALEASALLNKVMSEIEVAIFTFDDKQRLRLVNRAGERVLAQRAERILGRTAAEIGLAECLQGAPARTLDPGFAGRTTGRWGMRRSVFRQGGTPHHLLVIADLSRALREEERQAWQRLVRVLGHELNNSLAPVRSIAESLETLLRRDPRPADWEDDVRRGLHVISERAETLTRFMQDYARLARLPQPQLAPVDLSALVRRAVGVETRMGVRVEPGPDLTVSADADQLEQLLINLIRNAVDASLETSGGVCVTWLRTDDRVELKVADEGPGISNPANLFVPFFTTKPGGTGIGLALSRQIAEGHGGVLTLENRRDARGCEARLQLPLET
jgi:two-component system, NtrC family, nitrogen regulation sensor histidine kinase NtrY